MSVIVELDENGARGIKIFARWHSRVLSFCGGNKWIKIYANGTVGIFPKNLSQYKHFYKAKSSGLVDG